MSTEALPSLFSELMSSNCDGDRVKTKTRFEEQCQVLDAKLDRLVKTNKNELPNIVGNTSKAIQIISNSKTKCRLLKERLTSCMETLQCKRDDIRKQWLESLQHKYAHRILDEIQKLRKIPATVNESLLDKKYQHATDVLVSSIHMLESELGDTEALKELGVELHRLLDKLYSIFLEELIQELYMSTFRSVYRGTYDSSFEDVTYEKVFNCRMLKESSRSINFNVPYVTTLLECISSMGKIYETMEILKEECQSELTKIVQKLSKLMFDVVQRSTDLPLLELPPSQGQIFLSDLLQTIIGHFRQIAINNKIFLHLLGKTLASAGVDDSCYEVVDLYSNVQATIEDFVTNYIEMQPLTTLPRQNVSVFSNSQSATDLSTFFVPRSYSDSKCQTLFKCRDSAQGLAGNRKKANYAHLQKDRELELKDSIAERNPRKLTLVCKPSLRNITVMFSPLKGFVSEIESTLEVEPGTHCPLHAFIYDCASSFLDQVNSEVNRILENASMNLDSWTASIIPDDSSERPGSEKQILSSTLILNDNLKELKKLLSNLPDYSNHFLQLIYYVILDYKDLVHKAFKSLFDEEQNILSVSWAKDRDIRRLLKSFSNWKFLEISESGETIESPEEIRLRNKEESELLIRNLHSEEQSSWEIIRDRTVLFNLAILQESLQWFSAELLTFIDEFKSVISDSTLSETSEGRTGLYALNAAAGLQKLVKEYEDFSDVCLLALHLEVRAHCFHHLLQFGEGDVDACVLHLTEDLMKIDETLNPALTPKELKYIFEGLGELVASILIYNVSNMSKVNETLVKRMYRCIFVVQCCLANITMTREVSLERARQYIQLLNLTCDEIFNEIVEGGPRFKEQEYGSIFRIILEKEDAKPQVLGDYVDKLHTVFKRVSAHA